VEIGGGLGETKPPQVLFAGVIVPRPGPCNYTVPKYLIIIVKCIFNN